MSAQRRLIGPYVCKQRSEVMMMDNFSRPPRRRNRNLIIFFVALGVVVLLLSFFLTSLLINNQKSSVTATPTPPGSTGATCNGKGVAKNASGSYNFSWLHVNAQGFVVDSSNCVVHLVGVNMGGLFLGAAGHPDLQGIQWYKQHIPMNIVREAFNAYWWNTNVNVPNEQMGFRQWLETIVKWQEQSGNYVILDLATQFHDPPCGTGVAAPCPSQNQASTTTDPTQKSTYQPTALSALTDLAKLYANDPAVIFDVWNEPSPKEISGIGMQAFFQDMNQRINTVKQYAPNSIVMVYQEGVQDIASGSFPDYTQKNLLFDTHIYSARWSPSNIMPQVDFAHAHGQAYIVGEWGGKPGKPDPNMIIPFFKDSNVEGCYFFAGDLVTGKSDNPTGLNSIGQAVASGYGSIIGSTT